MAAIGTKLPFERLHVTIDGKDYELYGNVTVIGDRVTWRIDEVEIHGPYGLRPFRVRPESEFGKTVAVEIYRQCGDAITERMNDFVENRGGYAMLFGENPPASPFRRGIDHRPRPDERVFWLDAA